MPKNAKFQRRFILEVVEDLTVLGELDPALMDAALAAVEDLRDPRLPPAGQDSRDTGSRDAQLGQWSDLRLSMATRA
ncbi:MAG: hypothetical protein ACRDNZ_18375 [Streptosporangiaceae bacterium]